MIIVVMGVAGSGKTTIGSLLPANSAGIFTTRMIFILNSNRAKMSQGIALTDDDRAGWLASLKDLIEKNIQQNNSIILACSALKDSYRNMLDVNSQVRFIYLQGSYEQIKARLNQRSGHYMSADMLDSQFNTLEEPQNALIIDIANSPQEILTLIRKGLNL